MHWQLRAQGSYGVAYLNERTLWLGLPRALRQCRLDLRRPRSILQLHNGGAFCCHNGPLDAWDVVATPIGETLLGHAGLRASDGGNGGAPTV